MLAWVETSEREEYLSIIKLAIRDQVCPRRD